MHIYIQTKHTVDITFKLFVKNKLYVKSEHCVLRDVGALFMSRMSLNK